MHKGKQYPRDNQLRVLMGQWPYPKWCGEEYELEFDASMVWHGAAPLPTSTGPYSLTVQNVDLPSGYFELRGEIGTFGPNYLEVGFTFQLLPSKTRVEVSRMVWCDGDEALVRGNSGNHLSGLDVLDNNGSSSGPNGSPDKWCATPTHAVAVGY